MLFFEIYNKILTHIISFVKENNQIVELLFVFLLPPRALCPRLTASSPVTQNGR